MVGPCACGVVLWCCVLCIKALGASEVCLAAGMEPAYFGAVAVCRAVVSCMEWGLLQQSCVGALVAAHNDGMLLCPVTC